LNMARAIKASFTIVAAKMARFSSNGRLNDSASPFDAKTNQGNFFMRTSLIRTAFFCLAVGATGSARADTYRFADTTVGGLTFAGLLLQTTPSAQGPATYGLYCPATPREPNTIRQLDVTIFILAADDTVLAVAVPLSTAEPDILPDFSIRCDQSGQLLNSAKPPAKLKIQVIQKSARSRAKLVPKAGSNGEYEPVTLNGLTYSGLTANIFPDPKGPRYVWNCSVTALPNEVRSLDRVEFFMWAKGADTPFVWREWTGTPRPLVVRNGETKDCGADSGPLVDYGYEAAGMSIQITEILPQRRDVKTVLAKSRAASEGKR
jgi:hypothetical protein